MGCEFKIRGELDLLVDFDVKEVLFEESILSRKANKRAKMGPGVLYLLLEALVWHILDNMEIGVPGPAVSEKLILLDQLFFVFVLANMVFSTVCCGHHMYYKVVSLVRDAKLGPACLF